MDFSQKVISWYLRNKRDLPWRNTRDAYKIWLSEIILQQTRVSQGLPYYESFVGKFPTVGHLAEAKEDVVLKTWQGLGYYSRARNLHAAAKYISNELNGKFPNTYEEIRKLKGVGEYTAGAILSFAFNKAYPVVDGNVFRVLSRFFGMRTSIDTIQGKKEFTHKAGILLDKKNPGLFNQAIMEFGALQCVPKNPVCANCPLSKNCKAYLQNTVALFPVRSKKKSIHKRYFNYLIFKKNGKILIRKRVANDIWKNLYDFPLLETAKEVGKTELSELVSDKRKGVAALVHDCKHILTHQVIHAKFWEVNANYKREKGCFYISENQMIKYAFPRLIEKYLEKDFLKNS